VKAVTFNIHKKVALML